MRAGFLFLFTIFGFMENGDMAAADFLNAGLANPVAGFSVRQDTALPPHELERRAPTRLAVAHLETRRVGDRRSNCAVQGFNARILSGKSLPEGEGWGEGERGVASPPALECVCSSWKRGQPNP